MIHVSDVMSTIVRTCYDWDTLEVAAQILWESDIGCVVVVDERRRPIAMLTDRDVAMAAYTQGIALRQGRVSSAMSKHLLTVRSDATTREVELIMQDNQVRRLPVVDDEHRLIGVVSLSDIARTTANDPWLWPAASGVVRTLAEVASRRARAAVAAE
ncbi:MAG TPA: CBS domain-containing protein [Polyangiaceae bacterium]|jgi:CBS-domain-containing membrane protein